MIEIQKISNLNSLPKNESIVKWAIKALEDDNKKAEVVIRIVDMDLPLGYEKAHIPNAVGIPNQSIKAKDSKLVMMPGEFKEMMQAKGIGDDTLVVAYDSNKSLNACRLWWVMNYYGHTNIKVLNGGWRKWIRKNYHSSKTSSLISIQR